jgi:hypothetical protein
MSNTIQKKDEKEVDLVSSEYQEDGLYVGTINQEAIVTTGETHEDELEQSLYLYERTLNKIGFVIPQNNSQKK